MTNSMKRTVIKHPSWKRQTALERGLTVISVVDVLVCIALVIGIGAVVSDSASFNMTSSSIAEALGGRVAARGVQTDGKQPGERNVCLSPGCHNTASEVKKKIDINVHPCEDFYKFACGGFLNSMVIPADKYEINTPNLLVDKLDEQLRESIESNSTLDERKPFRLVKNLYKSCMNLTVIENKGLDPLHEMLKKLGGWPVLDGDNWDEDAFDWRTSMYKISGAGYPNKYFIDFDMEIDVKNSTKRIISLDQARLGLPREYLSKGFDDTHVQAYYSYMVDIAVILGAKQDSAERELKQSLLFEMELAKISLPDEKRRNMTQLYNLMTLTQVAENYPSVPWRECFNKSLPSTIIFGENETVNVVVPKYISALEKLMAITPKRVQANYAMWRVSKDSLQVLNDKIQKRTLEFWRVMRGTSEVMPRWKKCVRRVSDILPWSVGAMYVRKYFSAEAKQSVVGMVMDIRQQFIKTLEQTEWMDEKTRRSALEKAKAMSSYIGYPDELLDDEKLEELYKKLELSEDDYFGNELNVTLFNTEDKFNKLRKPVNKSESSLHREAAVVNAFYAVIENSIIFPAGVLQGAYFDNNRPRYMNYGAIGSVIGHEITHGFDDEGRQFDKDGHLVDWWTPLTSEKYLERTTCIVNQYANYTAPEVNLNLNGINTQGENIADIGGLKIAYAAYNSWVNRNGSEQKLPGLHYTPHQMFWISAAIVNCEKLRPELLRHIITTTRHSPGEFRTLGSFSNTVEFSKDFNCPVGSKMNPEKKCSVW